MLVSVAVALNEAEAEMICARLAAAGITASYKRAAGADVPQLGAGGRRDVMVEEPEAQAALATLATPEFSDAELDELSERSAPPPD